MDNPIFKRRSIRKFKQIPLSKEEINLLLKAGMAAPTARNNQEWEFVVIDNKEIMNKILEFHVFGKPLIEAALAIAVCGDTTKQTELGYVAQDCAAATQNILLQATMMNIGSCWVGIYPRPERVAGVTNLLGLPEHIVPITVIALGYPNDEKPENNNFFEEKIRYNKW